jgi:dynein heavy chain
VSYPELTTMEREIVLLQDIWGVKERWDGEWNKWKTVHFSELMIDDMDDKALEFQELIRKYEGEVKKWGVFDTLKNRVDNFKATLPLIEDLRHEAIRERHWLELRREIRGGDFDEKSEDFTLEKVFELQLTNYAAKIAELSDNAKKELKIEVQLNDIERIWKYDSGSDLEIQQVQATSSNEIYFKIASTENIYQLIDDHMVKLNNMKSSPYYKQFEDKIDLWETNINTITETLELLIIVQGKWQYLESIFKGQAEIQKLLAKEYSSFDKIHNSFKIEMTRINNEKNCLRSLTKVNFVSELQILNRKLEAIQKELNQLLKSKRAQFPRFFFLSNDDLLEIIGQSKNPEPVNKHIKKIFEGIQKIQFESGARDKPKGTYEISSVSSPEGEIVKLESNVKVDSQVDQWLKDLMDSMKATLKGIFYRAGSSFNTKKQDKLGTYVNDNPG